MVLKLNKNKNKTVNIILHEKDHRDVPLRKGRQSDADITKEFTITSSPPHYQRNAKVYGLFNLRIEC